MSYYACQNLLEANSILSSRFDQFLVQIHDGFGQFL